MKLMTRGPSTPSLMAAGIEKWGFLARGFNGSRDREMGFLGLNKVRRVGT